MIYLKFSIFVFHVMFLLDSFVKYLVSVIVFWQDSEVLSNMFRFVLNINTFCSILPGIVLYFQSLIQYSQVMIQYFQLFHSMF